MNNNLSKFMEKLPLVVNENMPAAKALSICSEKITSLLVVSDKDYKKKNQKLRALYIFIFY